MAELAAYTISQASTTPRNDLSDLVCWSRMQSEAGQSLAAIIQRKELERRVGDGLFMWGVGNAPNQTINALSRLKRPIPVVFSVMKSKPKVQDVKPTRTLAWQRYFDSHGVLRPLPKHVIVTSRGDSPNGAKRSHYALMCYSIETLTLSYGVPFDVSAYRNVGSIGASVGYSQVTALLRQVNKPSSSADYEVNLEASLVDSYWVRLADPIEIPADLMSQLCSKSKLDKTGWLELAADFRFEERRIQHQPSNHFLI